MTDYPETPRVDVADDYHGTTVSDPYRWLEDMESESTLAWVDAQNELTLDHIATIPERDRIRSRFEELWNFPRRSAPMRRGGWYFYTHNDGLQQQPILYREPVGGGEAAVVLDPNTLSEDGTVALMTLSVTADGKRLAYTLAEAGSDWQIARMMDAESGDHYPDELRQIKFTSLAWTPDGEGLFYAKFPDPEEFPGAPPSTNQRVYLHRLGTEQIEDELVFARPDEPDHGFQPLITDDDELLVLHVWQGTDTRNRLYYRRLESDGDFVRLLDDFDAKYVLVGHADGYLYVLTDRDAPRGRVVAIPLDRPDPDNWDEIVPETDDTLEFAAIVSGYIVTGALRNASHVVSLWALDGEPLGDVDLPSLGAVTEFAGKAGHEEFFLCFESFVVPPMVLRYDLGTGRLEPHTKPTAGVDTTQFETTQIWAKSPDGTDVPIFLTHRADLEPDGATPTILFGYGGFDIPMVPMYAPDRLGFVESGGIFALANLRGGGEFGHDWHRAGMFGEQTERL